MTRRVLALMADGAVSTQSELAAVLGARPAEVEALLAELAALGFVRDIACPTDGPRGGGCAGCVLGNACVVGRPSHVWTLTERGRRAVSKVRSGIA